VIIHALLCDSPVELYAKVAAKYRKEALEKQRTADGLPPKHSAMKTTLVCTIGSVNRILKMKILGFTG
jgi:hypothetical protein